MTPEIVQAVAEHLAAEPGTRRIFIVEEFEQTSDRGAASYCTSLSGLNHEPRDFIAERELEHEIDQRRETSDVVDGAAGMELIAELVGKWEP